MALSSVAAASLSTGGNYRLRMKVLVMRKEPVSKNNCGVESDGVS